MSTTDCSKAKNWGPVYFKRSALLGRIKNRICLVRQTAFILALDSPGRTKSMLSRYIFHDLDSSLAKSTRYRVVQFLKQLFARYDSSTALIVFHVPSADAVDELNWLSSSGSSSWILQRLALSATAAFIQLLEPLLLLIKLAFVALCQFCGPFFVKLALPFLFRSRFRWRKRTQPFNFFFAAFSPKQTLSIHGEY